MRTMKLIREERGGGDNGGRICREISGRGMGRGVSGEKREEGSLKEGGIGREKKWC